MKSGCKFKIKTFSKANHLFQEADSGGMEEYAKLKKEFVLGFLKTIIDWIKDLKI